MFCCQPLTGIDSNQLANGHQFLLSPTKMTLLFIIADLHSLLIVTVC